MVRLNNKNKIKFKIYEYKDICIVAARILERNVFANYIISYNFHAFLKLLKINPTFQKNFI